MRILLVHHSYPPEGTGGSEIYTAALARRLAKDHDIAVLYRSADPARPDHDLVETSRDGVALFSLNNLHRNVAGFEAYRDPRAAAVAARVLDQTRPDVVHVGHLSGLSTGLVFEARLRGAAVVITLHDFWPVCPLGQLLTLGLEVCPGPAPRRCLGCLGGQLAPGPRALGAVARKLRIPAASGRLLARVGSSAPARVARRLDEMREVLGTADVLLSPSRFLRDRMAALGVAGIRVLENGHEPLCLPPRTPDPEGRVRFGFVGAAIPSKGAHVLAEAFRKLNDPRATLRIHGPFLPYHGDTGYEARVRDLLDGAAGEILRGPFPHDQLGAVLAGLDVVVVPSIWEENAPLTVQEAFLARLPLLVSDHGGLAEMVREGLDGLRFGPGDPMTLAAAMRRLLDDPGLLRRLGTSPPRVPTMDEHVSALEDVYLEARRRFRDRVARVGVVVVNRARPDQTARAVRSCADPIVQPRMVVVENGPGPEPTLPHGTELLRLPENLGWAAGVNAGVARLRGLGCNMVLLLNNDAVLEPGCLRRLAEALEGRGLAAVGPVVIRERDGRVESRGARFDPRWGRQRLWGHGEVDTPREGRIDAESLSGAALMISVAALERVGPFDEAYFFSFEETDWCARARLAGLGLAVVLGARVRHTGSASLGRSSSERLYYATRNHMRAAECLVPLGHAARWPRRWLILGLNLVHAVRQRDVPRLAGMRAVLQGASDFRKGRFGPRREGSTKARVTEHTE